MSALTFSPEEIKKLISLLLPCDPLILKLEHLNCQAGNINRGEGVNRVERDQGEQRVERVERVNREPPLSREKYNDRPTFTCTRGPLRAGGVLIYRKTGTGLEFLMIKNTEGRYEDIGGKTDRKDRSILDTIARETGEETNGVIAEAVVRRQLQTAALSVYNLNSKYVVYLIQANRYEAAVKSEQFGTIETHDQFPRTIHWVPSESVQNSPLHPRLDLPGLLAVWKRL
jgi:hypothetical protein